MHEEEVIAGNDPVSDPNSDSQEGNESGAEGGGKRTVSEVAFPYVDLDQAIEVPLAIHAQLGKSGSSDQVSGVLDLKGGAFSRRIGGAKQFGLIAREGQSIAITPLGLKIIASDPQTAKAARVQAFYNVELYKKLYDDFKGSKLPMDKGLENHMKQVGVPEKQAETARQIFRRSARQAGFFTFGDDRLIEPPLKDDSDPSSLGGEHGSGSHQSTTSKGEKVDPLSDPGEEDNELLSHLDAIHPSLVGMLLDLPKKGEKWEADDFQFWTETFLQNLRYAYKVPKPKAGSDSIA